VTAYNGLFFVGLPWLHDGKSGLIYGVGGDAAYVVQKIISRGRPRIAGQIETRALGMRRGESQRGPLGERQRNGYRSGDDAAVVSSQPPAPSAARAGT
jgi:hypothetical protein